MRTNISAAISKNVLLEHTGKESGELQVHMNENVIMDHRIAVPTPVTTMTAQENPAQDIATQIGIHTTAVTTITVVRVMLVHHVQVINVVRIAIAKPMTVMR